MMTILVIALLVSNIVEMIFISALLDKIASLTGGKDA
jgi:hypothetical protein